MRSFQWWRLPFVGLFALSMWLPLSAAGQGLSDAEIESSLGERYQDVEALREVVVAVDGGVVTLTGEVADSADRSLAREMSMAHEGVIDVRSELVLGGEVRDRIGKAFDRSLVKLRMLIGYLPLFVAAVIIVFVFAILAKVVARPAYVKRFFGGNAFLEELARQALRICVLFVGILIALDLLDATALFGAVFGAAGLAGLAIGFAFKDLIENYVASILLSLRQPFRPNDHVVIDGNEGIVLSLNSRATILMTIDGNHLRLPNALVFKSVMLNYTRNAERRFDFPVGVGTGEDLTAAQRIGLDVLKSMKGVLADPPPLALVTDLAASSVTIQYFGWVNQNEASYPKVKGEAIRLVKLALEREGMDLPEPIYRVNLVSGEAQSAADKPAVSKKLDTARAAQGDVSIDPYIGRQIEEEKRKTRETNLLREDAPPE